MQVVILSKNDEVIDQILAPWHYWYKTRAQRVPAEKTLEYGLNELVACIEKKAGPVICCTYPFGYRFRYWFR